VGSAGSEPRPRTGTALAPRSGPAPIGPRAGVALLRSRADSTSSIGVDVVVHGDVRHALQRLRPESVQLAVTSPPYNLRMPYSGYSDDRAHGEYLAWLKEVWRDLLRVLVPGGRFALNVAPTSIKAFRPIHHELTADLRDLGYIMRTEVIWYKQTMGRRTAWGSWRSPSNPHIIPSWEYVLVFSKGQWNLPGRKEDIDISSEEFQQISDGFWQIPPERSRRGHPAPFPEELIARLVKFYTYRGNVVLDPFGGTGTVGAVSRRLGRHYVNIDASAEYCEQARQRIAAAAPVAGAPKIPAPAMVELGPTADRPRASQ
jgi:DNA modification methylase